MALDHGGADALRGKGAYMVWEGPGFRTAALRAFPNVASAPTGSVLVVHRSLALVALANGLGRYCLALPPSSVRM